MSYMNITDKKDIPDGLLRAAWSSIADTAIAQPQDFLGLGDETRINVPGTLGPQLALEAFEGGSELRVL